jgi:heme/copper-type cytochrome/quinol oxidase subunit 2
MRARSLATHTDEPRGTAAILPIAAAALLALSLVRAPARKGGSDGPRAAPHPPAAILATARAARWTFTYPGPDGTLGTPDDVPGGGDLHVPAGRDVELILTSDDYLDRFSVPGLGLHGMAVPGLPSSLTIRAPRPGTFAMAADPMCGRRPSHGGRLIAETLPDFASWLGSIGRSAATRARSAPRLMGASVARRGSRGLPDP